MENRTARWMVLFIASLLVSSMVVGVDGRMIGDDGDIEGISITGSITHDPDPIVPAPPGAFGVGYGDACDLQFTPEECNRTPYCMWFFGGVSPGGIELEAQCLPDEKIIGRGIENVTITLDGITADAPYQANIFVAGFSDVILVEHPDASAQLAREMTQVSLEVSNIHFSMNRFFTLVICLNKTACPRWDVSCAACTSNRIQTSLPPPPGETETPEMDYFWPLLRFEGGGLTGIPDLVAGRLHTIRGNITVLEEGSRWRMNCSLVGRVLDGDVTTDLCLPGVFEPNVCEWSEPTPPEGIVIKLRIGSDVVPVWRPGEYALRCHVVDDSDGNQVLGDSLVSEWSTSFNVEGSRSTGMPPPGGGPTSSTSQADCGDFICSGGENSGNCCMDCGCPVGFACVENGCVGSVGPPGGTATPRMSTTLVLILVIAVCGFYALGLNEDEPSSS